MIKDNGGNHSTDVFSAILGEFHSRAPDIVSAIYPDETVTGELDVQPTLLRGYGGMSYALCKVTVERKGCPPLSFLAKYFGEEPPETYAGERPPWVSNPEMYRFLREDCKVKSVPRTYKTREDSRVLFLEWYDNAETLKSRVEGKTGEELRKELKKIWKPLLELQYNATKVALELKGSKVKKLFPGRDVISQAENYFKIIRGRRALSEKVMQAYGLIARAYEGDWVNHGDLGAQNILIIGDEIKFLDPELRMGSFYNDVGVLPAYLEREQDACTILEKLTKDFELTRLEVMVDAIGADIDGKILRREDFLKRARFGVFASNFHSCLRGRAKTMTNPPDGADSSYIKEVDGRLETQMKTVLGCWIADREKFGLNDNDDMLAVEVLMRSFKQKPLTPPQTRQKRREYVHSSIFPISIVGMF